MELCVSSDFTGAVTVDKGGLLLASTPSGTGSPLGSPTGAVVLSDGALDVYAPAINETGYGGYGVASRSPRAMSPSPAPAFSGPGASQRISGHDERRRSDSRRSGGINNGTLSLDGQTASLAATKRSSPPQCPRAASRAAKRCLLLYRRRHQRQPQLRHDQRQRRGRQSRSHTGGPQGSVCPRRTSPPSSAPAARR